MLRFWQQLESESKEQILESIKLDKVSDITKEHDCSQHPLLELSVVFRL